MLTLLSNADVYAPEPLGRQHLLVAGERIVWMGDERPDLPARLGAAEHDLGGARLVPGFVDSHCHITGGGGESGYASAVPPVSVSRFTRGGTTTVVGLLGTDDAVRTVGSLAARAMALREEGLSAWIWCGGYHLPPATITGSVRGDILHVDPVIGVGELALSDHRSSQPTLDELLRVAAHTHVAGMMSGKAGVVHLHLGDGERGLALVREALDTSELPGRVFNPTHVNRRRALFEEALALAGRGCTIDITAFPVAEDEDAWSAETALVRYLDFGAAADRVTISSDGGGCLPVFDDQGRIATMDVGDPAALAGALRSLLDAGVPLETALPPITSNVADLLRLPRKGRLRTGADADLVTLDDAGRIRDVMARGRWHVRDGRLLVAGTFDSPEQRTDP